VIVVLHTHSRALDYHPHIHAVMPAAIVDKRHCLWRTKQGNYLFNYKALAKVFRAKLLTRLAEENLTLPKAIPQKWMVDCKQAGSGDKALIYLGRYLYRGVIREKDILSCKDGKVTYRYHNSKTKRFETKTVSGARFLWLVLQWLFKFDPKKLLKKVKQRPQLICKCCGAIMEISRTRIPVVESLTLNMALVPT